MEYPRNKKEAEKFLTDNKNTIAASPQVLSHVLSHIMMKMGQTENIVKARNLREAQDVLFKYHIDHCLFPGF